MTGYAKLFSSILASTVWQESKETKLLWITMLAASNRDGIVEASVPGLAYMAKLTLKETEEALSVLMSPDPYSRTPAFEGRRIERCDGGWLILNYDVYREKMGAAERTEYNRVKQQESRARKNAREGKVNQRKVTPYTPGYVYYARSGDQIKIGWSQNPWARIWEFKTSNPNIELMAMEPGTLETERLRHSQFGKFRINENREWFIADAEVINFAQSLRPVSVEGEDGDCQDFVNDVNDTSASQRHTEAKEDSKTEEEPLFPFVCPDDRETNPTVLRLYDLFNRKPSTMMDRKEKKAFREAKITEDDLLAVEEWWNSSHPEWRPGEDYRKRKLLTLLNDWRGAVDTATSWKAFPPIIPAQKSPFKNF